MKRDLRHVTWVMAILLPIAAVATLLTSHALPQPAPRQLIIAAATASLADLEARSGDRPIGRTTDGAAEERRDVTPSNAGLTAIEDRRKDPG